MYIVVYKGKFGFIKPWTAVRDGETFSQQFLTPSIVEGIEKKLFPEQLQCKGISKILRHKLNYSSVDMQQEVTQARGWKVTKLQMIRDHSIIKRGIFINPVLYLAFDSEDDAKRAACQHICLCRNEDVMLPCSNVMKMSEDEFDSLDGFELRFCGREQSKFAFLVGYNRFDDAKPMYGWLEYNGIKL